MRFLVTGAAGFIGSHVCDRLLDHGHSVVGLDSFDDFYPRSVKERNLAEARTFETFSLHEADIRDARGLNGLRGEFDAVIHLAARVGVRPSTQNPRLYSDVNVTGTSTLLELAEKRNIRTFVFASSSSVYGDNEKVPFSETDPVDHPISPYAATKRSGELLCHAATHLDGITTVCLRLFTVYGPRQRPDLAVHKFARLMSDGQPIPMFGDGTTSRDYTYIDDITQGVDAALKWAISNPGRHEVVNLGEQTPISLDEMIDALATELGVEPTVEKLPMQPGDVPRTYADTSKAAALFGYRPRTSFRQGIRAFVKWFRSHGAQD